jgi:hypothetical protein
MTDLDLGAPIQPGSRAAGIAVGRPALGLPAPLGREALAKGERLDYACVSIWVEEGRVKQVGVRSGYGGKLDQVIAIGSSLADVERTVGAVHEDEEDNLVVSGRPGFCFETATWRGHRLEDNRDARITAIFVFGEEAGEQ